MIRRCKPTIRAVNSPLEHTLKRKPISWFVLLLLAFAVLLGNQVLHCAMSDTVASRAYALETEPYVPGQDYHTPPQEDFIEQDPGYQSAIDATGTTHYLLTCPFYLEWTSPDMVISQGEDGFIGCGAVGLEPLRYAWDVSTDGGVSFAPIDLFESESALLNMQANRPTQAPYIFRCTITNGDGMSTIETEISIQVLDDEPTTPIPGLPATGDDLLLPALVGIIAISGICVLLTILYRRGKKHKDCSPLERSHHVYDNGKKDDK